MMDDLLIRGGHVIDGSGAPGRDADVSVDGGRIVAVAGAPVARPESPAAVEPEPDNDPNKDHYGRLAVDATVPFRRRGVAHPGAPSGSTCATTSADRPSRRGGYPPAESNPMASLSTNSGR
jgi:hypothetical protein